MTAKRMIVAGVMSGTSADGIDVAVVRVAGVKRPKLTIVAHEAFPYPAALRAAVLAAMNAKKTSTAELARLNWRLGLAYAEAVKATADRHKLSIDLIGCHGQTLYHQGRADQYAGRNFACTWQAGEAALIAAELKVPVVSNFRPADMAAGGQGAPLVPLFDQVYFGDPKRGRVLQNIGGIANLTAIPAGSEGGELMAFDTGPGNMVIDALTQKLFRKPYDRNGAIAAKGLALETVIEEFLRNPYFKRKPPRSAGREEFGREYAAAFQTACRRESQKPQDAIASATALTVESIVRSFKQFVWSSMRNAPVDYIVSGGGAKNRTLMQMLSSRLEPMGCKLATTEQFGLPAEAKEAAAFALLAWATWNRVPGNVPSATGATRAALLGQIAYA
ncbi:anhydro-N-acetylmuramic acid kinase [Occallatibacter savannae]|uniref:anhydro-N-acetylmuramic acid kinase n=1 Tax=Occallatibacter savannae TaxID=1002691 RepID=UPI000D69E6AC|nr:anhydro-N-acetylmuramic acid kinase [Occallatibacter savannae]